MKECIDCPSNCMGLEQSTLCVYSSDTGESLNTIIKRLEGISTPSSPSLVDDISTDDIISTSVVRNPASTCATKIVNRTFNYTITAASSSSDFSWSLLDVMTALPKSYSVATVRVKAVGNGTNTSKTLVDSNNLSAGFSIDLSQYPVTVDFLIRVQSPCGDIDLEQSVYLINPAQTGKYNSTLSVKELLSSTGVDLSLTDQLDGLESKVSSVDTKLNSMDSVVINKVELPLPAAVQSLSTQVNELFAEIGNPGQFEISYVDDNSSKKDELTDIISDLYKQINTLSETISTQEIKIENLQSQIDSLNALA